ncbi:unnamed protein product, partial [Prunus brigantina]
MQVDSKPFPPPVINMYDCRPARGRVFDRLGAQNPSTSVGRRNEATPRPLRTFRPPVVRDDRWYHIQPRGNVQPLTRTQLRRMQRRAQQAREQIPQAEGFRRQRELVTTDEPLPAPIAPVMKVASLKASRTWSPRKDEDLRGKGAVSAGPKPMALGKTDEGIVDLALKNTKVEGLLITRGSDSAIKAVYQANREAKARGAPGDALAETRRALEEEDESSTPPETEAATHRALGVEGPKVEGRSDPFFGHEPEDDPLLGISDEEYEEVLGTI